MKNKTTRKSGHELEDLLGNATLQDSHVAAKIVYVVAQTGTVDRKKPEDAYHQGSLHGRGNE